MSLRGAFVTKCNHRHGFAVIYNSDTGGGRSTRDGIKQYAHRWFHGAPPEFYEAVSQWHVQPTAECRSHLARFAQVWLKDGMGPSGQWVTPGTMRTFLTPTPHSGTRLLGWDTPDFNGEEPSIFGTLISKAAYGHTGYTGTQLWIDPVNDLFLVFLTNRAFDPKARDSLKGLKAIRTSLSDAAIRLVPHPCTQELVSTC